MSGQLRIIICNDANVTLVERKLDYDISQLPDELYEEAMLALQYEIANELCRELKDRIDEISKRA